MKIKYKIIHPSVTFILHVRICVFRINSKQAWFSQSRKPKICLLTVMMDLKIRSALILKKSIFNIGIRFSDSQLIFFPLLQNGNTVAHLPYAY